MEPNGTTTRRWTRAALCLAIAVTLSVPAAGGMPALAAPTSAAEAGRLVEQAGRELTGVDEQVHQAQLAVAELQRAARAADEQAAQAQAAVDAYQPQLRAIAQSGFTGTSQSRVAAFLTSDSAADLVQQMTTLDLIADHTNDVISDVAAAREVATQAQKAAAAASAEAEAALSQLQGQQAELQERIASYQADFDRLTAAEQARVTAALAGPTLDAPPAGELAPAPSGAAGLAVRTALGQVGDSYVWGGTGPDGFDCSGLTMYAYAAAGVALPHSSKAQSRLGRPVSRAELQPGDLVYFYEPVSHVGRYIGDGKMVHARTFGQPVAVTTVDQSGYGGARRVV